MPSRVIDAETRHRVMASIRKRDTRPEMTVRRALHAQGLRFRLHRSDLPGTPDVVLPGRGIAVLVHGCFWHQHAGCSWSRVPRGNTSYWGPKLRRNVERDVQAQQQLEALGWKVIVIWECEARNEDRLRQIAQSIRLSTELAPRRRPSH
jgi:DNA mismatch endonuclease (patch repair protein)